MKPTSWKEYKKFFLSFSFSFPFFEPCFEKRRKIYDIFILFQKLREGKKSRSIINWEKGEENEWGKQKKAPSLIFEGEKREIHLSWMCEDEMMGQKLITSFSSLYLKCGAGKHITYISKAWGNKHNTSKSFPLSPIFIIRETNRTNMKVFTFEREAAATREPNERFSILQQHNYFIMLQCTTLPALPKLSSAIDLLST